MKRVKDTTPHTCMICGEKVKLLRNGKDERGNVTYARSYITGHVNKPF